MQSAELGKEGRLTSASGFRVFEKQI